jgi:hypothetical protein
MKIIEIKRIDVKKLFFVSLFLFSYVVLYSAENVLTTFLEYIFDSSSFRYETNDMGDAELLFAYRYKTPFGIFDKAIVMYQDNNSFHPILYINNDKLINADGRIIFED